MRGLPYRVGPQHELLSVLLSVVLANVAPSVSGKCCGPIADACDSVRRENLQRLLDDRSFKEEIVHFSLSEESAVVKAAHRADLCPVLMRYLYYLKCEHKPGGSGTHP